jgi:hypothetical protein
MTYCAFQDPKVTKLKLRALAHGLVERQITSGQIWETLFLFVSTPREQHGKVELGVALPEFIAKHFGFDL